MRIRSITSHLICALLGIGLLFGGDLRAGTIVPDDNGFETPGLGGGFADQPASAWTFGAYAGIAANNSAFNVNGAHGNQAAFLQGNGTSVSQTLSGFVAGSASVTFSIESRKTGGLSAGGVPISVYLDSTLLGTYLADDYLSFNTITTDSIAVSAGSHVLSFRRDSFGIYVGDRTSFIDDVTVSNVTASPVPEPSSLALAGLGGIGLAIGAYRRRLKSAI